MLRFYKALIILLLVYPADVQQFLALMEGEMGQNYGS
jgi:hypothetical protein